MRQLHHRTTGGTGGQAHQCGALLSRDRGIQGYDASKVGAAQTQTSPGYLQKKMPRLPGVLRDRLRTRCGPRLLEPKVDESQPLGTACQGLTARRPPQIARRIDGLVVGSPDLQKWMRAIGLAWGPEMGATLDLGKSKAGELT